MSAATPVEGATPNNGDRGALRRKGLLLVWIGEGWNAGEAVAAFAFAWLSASFALFALGSTASWSFSRESSSSGG